MTNRRHCVECDELVQDPSVPEEHKASCSHSRERLDSYARGRADERAAIVRWLRGCMRPDFARAAGIDNGDHIAWAQRSADARAKLERAREAMREIEDREVRCGRRNCDTARALRKALAALDATEDPDA